jgi:hypothetical protein
LIFGQPKSLVNGKTSLKALPSNMMVIDMYWKFEDTLHNLKHSIVRRMELIWGGSERSSCTKGSLMREYLPVVFAWSVLEFPSLTVLAKILPPGPRMISEWKFCCDVILRAVAAEYQSLGPIVRASPKSIGSKKLDFDSLGAIL